MPLAYLMTALIPFPFIASIGGWVFREVGRQPWLVYGQLTVKDAISHYKRALSDREKVLGRGHPDTLATTANLAAAYQAAGRMPSAMQLSEQCCADSERLLGPDHADTLGRMANLAHLYYAVGRVGDAITLLRDTASRCERVLPYGDPLIQAIQQSLANIADT